MTVYLPWNWYDQKWKFPKLIRFQPPGRLEARILFSESQTNPSNKAAVCGSPKWSEIIQKKMGLILNGDALANRSTQFESSMIYHFSMFKKKTKKKHIFRHRPIFSRQGNTLLGTNRSHFKRTFESMIFLFPRWDMLVSSLEGNILPCHDGSV